MSPQVWPPDGFICVAWLWCSVMSSGVKILVLMMTRRNASVRVSQYQNTGIAVSPHTVQRSRLRLILRKTILKAWTYFQVWISFLSPGLHFLSFKYCLSGRKGTFFVMKESFWIWWGQFTTVANLFHLSWIWKNCIAIVSVKMLTTCDVDSHCQAAGCLGDDKDILFRVHSSWQ